MEIFLTGGSGEIGRPAVASLVTNGHLVRATTSSAQADQIVSSLGADPVRVNLFDGRAVQGAVGNPDAIVHLATAIPPSATMADPGVWTHNDRLRTETTAHLVAAAVARGAERLILQSYFAVQAPRDEAWIEADPVLPSPPWSGIGVMDSMRTAEEAVADFARGGAVGVVLRFGSLYSETSEQLQAQVRLLETGEAFIPESGQNYWPYVASNDAGRAVEHALTMPAGTYNVADDDPVTLETFWTMASRSLGRPLPALPARADVGGPMADILLGSWRVSNRAFCQTSGWKPTVPSVTQGWPQAASRYLAERPALRPVGSGHPSRH